jgi:hypothetical protein
MNRAILVTAIVIVLIAGGYFLLGRPAPDAPVALDAPGAPAPSRIVPKKVAPPSPIVTDAPKKTTPKKTETPAAAVPAPAAAPTLASLTIESDVPGASVFIDRQFVGNTPLSLDKLQPGTKRVQLTATGFDSVQRTIDLAPGPNAVSIRVKEVSLSARTAVVHKHGIGSCDGTLSATLDGLRYDTSNKGDAFTLPYAQVEQFAIDYLQKNLRVKQKGGKTWNFTDKNDNADVLFVFHREVEAARKKLAEGYARRQ